MKIRKSLNKGLENKKKRSKLGYLCIWIRNLLLFFLVTSLSAVLLAGWLPVRYTPLMFIRSVENVGAEKYENKQTWVSIDEMPSSMIMAAIACEDNLFMKHRGFDFVAMGKARELNKKGKKVYGASTITQQTAKNLFLWPGRSYFRKGMEAYFTVLLETFWSKKRIMEVYLNVVEMGDGVYGIEEAAQHYYHKNASKLTEDQCVSIAVCFPNPRVFNPLSLTPKMKSKKERIKILMKKLNRTEWGIAK